MIASAIVASYRHYGGEQVFSQALDGNTLLPLRSVHQTETELQQSHTMQSSGHYSQQLRFYTVMVSCCFDGYAGTEHTG